MTHHFVNWVSLSEPHIDDVKLKLLHSNSTACIHNSNFKCYAKQLYTGLRKIRSYYIVYMFTLNLIRSYMWYFS